MTRHNHGRQRSHGGAGQIIAVFALGLVAMIAMVALVIEGGNLFAQQRIAQNGSDAAANAGALVIAEGMAGAVRDGSHVNAAIQQAIAENGLQTADAEYTDDFGTPIGQPVVDSGAIPAGARGVRVGGNRAVEPTFARVIGFNQLTASADATAVAGALSATCVADEDGCTLLPITFPVKVFQCDGSGTLVEGGAWIGAPPPEAGSEGYWKLVPAEDLPGGTFPDGNPDTMAILPLCKGSGESTGAFGWLDLTPDIPNLAGEIEGPLDFSVPVPDWFQAQTGNPNSVEDEIEAYLHQPVLIPLHNGACREDPGETATCPLESEGVDPVGNNTWYYVHTMAVFYIDQVLVQGSNTDECASEPGGPLVPITSGSGFLGCLKGWFVNYVTSGPINPGGTIIPGVTPIGMQLIK